ncbi:Uncharacterized protein TCM_022078 [Theobroma cacao]|uniref:Uncharacterized protein n=1 Tax=Theobroma cacao TaxID=3641 RepID=A0A061EZR6_THECC|nr:Uncharacterized protein TCM_022078 [Theobroma cacao]
MTSFTLHTKQGGAVAQTADENISLDMHGKFPKQYPCFELLVVNLPTSRVPIYQVGFQECILEIEMK